MKQLFSSIIFLLLFSSSCKKLVEVDLPVNELTRAVVFSGDITANAAQLAIYSKMSAGFSFYSLSVYPGLSADELLDYEGSQTRVQLYTNNLIAGNAAVDEIWSQAYEYIYASNAVLEGIENNNNISAEVKKQLKGEAKFSRAFNYFYLVNLFGDVPLLLSTNYTANASASRSSTELVYQQIIEDLKSAQADLNMDYVAADGTSVVLDRLRPTKPAATALLSRVYLFTKDYENAESMASSVINDSRFALDTSTSLDNVFLKNNSEAIWQVTPGSLLGNTLEGLMFILAGPPSQVALDSSLCNSFESGDRRRANWIGAYSDGATTWYFPNKYKIQYDPSNPRENVDVLRLAEQYLIRAEARVFVNNLAGAREDLNAIRNRAGLSDITSSERDELLTFLLEERRAELFTEWGHRWLDLKRTGKIDEVMNIAAAQKGSSWQSYQQLYPIPQSNRARNPNLSQNAGFN
ncbi:MAG TPA: RagB/SusD family nutrient uptake outer membrane protein [Sphingobacteriaceae bacterium]